MTELPQELADLYAAERAATAATAARAAVRARLAATVGHAPLGAAVGGGLGAAGKLLAVLALTVGVGAATVAALHHGSAQVSATPAKPAARQVVASAAVVAPSPAAAPASSPTITVATEPPAARPTHPSGVTHAATPEDRPAPAPQPVDNVPPSQVAVIRDAWLALSARNPARALELVQGDERVHPDGPLAEERSALTIAALAALGRLDDARAGAATFEAKYPSSVHHDLIVHALTPEASR